MPWYTFLRPVALLVIVPLAIVSSAVVLLRLFHPLFERNLLNTYTVSALQDFDDTIFMTN